MTTTTPTKEPRTILWIIAGLSLCTLVFSSYTLAKRINSFNSDRGAPLFSFRDVQEEAFLFQDHPFTIKEVTVDEQPYVRITYAEEILLLPVTVPPKQPLPTVFDRQREWLSIMIMADRAGITLDEMESKIDSGEITPRLIVATRTPFGAEPAKEKRFDSIEHEQNESWGEVRRDLWEFDFYEMNPDGTITVHEPKRFPESGKSLARRQNYAKLKGEPIPQRDPQDLVEYSWQYGAAIKLTPRPPAITMENQALRNAGWSLPAAAASILTLIASIFFAIAPPRATE
ncbi:MAG: hypothetical protein JJ974_07320 [Phycisphaerales bacterium]|nr:hypothetical protein [Phycisphaerales bacterium]